MQKQRDRLEAIMDGVLGTIKLRDKCTGEASGPQLVAAQDANGGQGITVGWQLTVWLQHDKLLGQDPIGVSVPVGMMLPPSELVDRITRQLLEEARNIRFRANQEAAGLSMPDPSALRGIGQNESRQ
jgi:hypothetical protein